MRHPIDVLQVVEHPFDDPFLADRFQKAWLKRDRSSEARAQPSAAIIGKQNASLLERIDQDTALIRGVTHEEVAGEIDPLQRKSES